jgi:flagellar hook-length control protein FliK
VHASAALPMSDLPGETRGTAQGGAQRPAAANSRFSFGEVMLRQVALATIVAGPQAASPAVVPGNRETRKNLAAEPATAGNSLDPTQAIKTPEQKTMPPVPLAGEPPVFGAESSRDRSPCATDASQAASHGPVSIAAKAPTTTPQSPASASTATHAKTRKFTNTTATPATASRETATRSEADVTPMPAEDAGTTGQKAGSGDTRSDAIAAPARDPQASVTIQVAHGAAKAIQGPAPTTISVMMAPSTTGTIAAGSREGHDIAGSDNEAKNAAADAAAAPVAGPEHAIRPRQRSQGEAPRSIAGPAASPVNPAVRSAAVASQSIVTGSPGVADTAGPDPNILRTGPASSALPSLNGAPATVSAAFTRMDSAAPPQVLLSAPQRLSVGVRDSGLGWVEIRTHTAEGQVSAVLAIASGEAQAALQANLPELRDYLAGQHVRVDQLASERFTFSGGSREAAPQQEGRDAPSRDFGSPGGGPPLAAACSERAEESLSYISVRV